MELKNDLSIRGTLHSVDQYLNIKLNNIRIVDQEKYPYLVRSLVCPAVSFIAFPCETTCELKNTNHHQSMIINRDVSRTASSGDRQCDTCNFQQQKSTLKCCRRHVGESSSSSHSRQRQQALHRDRE